jgi:hypothetical protein
MTRHDHHQSKNEIVKGASDDSTAPEVAGRVPLPVNSEADKKQEAFRRWKDFERGLSRPP